jgi:rubrerythrin
MTMPMLQLPEGAPATIREAFAHIAAVTKPSVLDIQVLVLVEAAGQAMYRKSAEDTDNAEIVSLLHASADEEFLHAERASQALKAMGVDFPAPAAEDNPYLADGTFPLVEVSPQAMRKFSELEFGGNDFYGLWADNVGNEEAARLFRISGPEEIAHGERLIRAAEILESEQASA